PERRQVLANLNAAKLTRCAAHVLNERRFCGTRGRCGRSWLRRGRLLYMPLNRRFRRDGALWLRRRGNRLRLSGLARRRDRRSLARRLIVALRLKIERLCGLLCWRKLYASDAKHRPACAELRRAARVNFYGFRHALVIKKSSEARVGVGQNAPAITQPKLCVLARYHRPLFL